MPTFWMTTLVHGKDLRASELILKVQQVEDFPLKVEVGRSTYTIRNKSEARKFALGVMAALEAREIEKEADFVG